MKKTIIKIFLYSTIFVAFSCNKQLNTTPTLSIDQSQALNTSSDVKVALTGCYADFGNRYFYGGRIFLEADLLADNNEIDWEGTYQELTQIHNKTIPVDNSFVADTWLAGYAAINDVNNVLSALGVVDNASKDRVEGEAKFLRGASYFELVKRYAKDFNDGTPANNPGVPIVLEPTREINEASKVKRNTVAEVYAQVLSDLKDAEAKLPATNGFFATKGAASAMLARVYLQQANYSEAANAANRAITSSEAELTPTYAEAFGAPNTAEDIFALQVTNSSGTQGFNEFYSSAQRGDVLITNQHLGLYQSGDARKSLFYASGGSTYSGKFEELYGNVHTIRVAEMYLIRAEANFRLGTAVGDTPLKDINRIRNRVKLPSYTAGQLTLDKILKERKLELAFEGFALDDIKRLKQSVGGLQWNSFKLIFPIPKRETIVNSNLSQNDGY